MDIISQARETFHMQSSVANAFRRRSLSAHMKRDEARLGAHRSTSREGSLATAYDAMPALSSRRQLGSCNVDRKSCEPIPEAVLPQILSDRKNIHEDFDRKQLFWTLFSEQCL